MIQEIDWDSIVIQLDRVNRIGNHSNGTGYLFPSQSRGDRLLARCMEIMRWRIWEG